VFCGETIVPKGLRCSQLSFNFTIRNINIGEMIMKKANRIIKVLIASLAILCFQVLYYQLTVVLLQKSAEVLPAMSNDCYLMLHHTYEFLLVFLLTLLICNFKHIDFGYHIKDWKKGLLWGCTAITFQILVRIILNIAYGFRGLHFQADTFIFQLFFSGFGEEILFRSVPFAILPLAWGDEMSISIGSKFKVYIDLLISALFFSLAHISFQFGVSGISFNWIQISSAFVMGIFIGMVFKKTNSVWTCMIIHGIVNAIAVTM